MTPTPALEAEEKVMTLTALRRKHMAAVERWLDRRFKEYKKKRRSILAKKKSP